MPASSLFALESIIQQRIQQHSQDTGETVPQHLDAALLCTEQFVPNAVVFPRTYSIAQALYKAPS